MFTGIIETLGTVVDVAQAGTNRVFWIESAISSQLHEDQSVSHNGICLTVDALRTGAHRVTAIQETLNKTNAGTWQSGTRVNLERCLAANGRFDGHFVQGHADGTGTCLAVTEMDGSTVFRFQFPGKFAPLVIEKGSIALNGISLTVFDVTDNEFSVAIIPYTLSHTNMGSLEPGHTVNLEFDMIGKYLNRHFSLQKSLST